MGKSQNFECFSLLLQKVISEKPGMTIFILIERYNSAVFFTHQHNFREWKIVAAQHYAK